MGKRKLIKNLKSREQHKIRKQWRLQKRDRRKLLKENAQIQVTPLQTHKVAIAISSFQFVLLLKNITLLH